MLRIKSLFNADLLEQMSRICMLRRKHFSVQWDSKHRFHQLTQVKTKISYGPNIGKLTMCLPWLVNAYNVVKMGKNGLTNCSLTNRDADSYCHFVQSLQIREQVLVVETFRLS